MIGTKGLTKMTSKLQKKTDPTTEDKMAQVWRSYNEAQQAWRDMVEYNKNDQTDSSKQFDVTNK